LAIAVFVLFLATLGAAAARADEVSPAATTSAEPTPEATPTESTTASDPVDPPDMPSDEPTAVPDVPTSEGPDGNVSALMETGTGGGEGGGTATPTSEESAGAEQAPVEEGTLAAAAQEVRDPRASIGDVDCTTLTVPVTLDNSRSSEAVTYEVAAEVPDDLDEFEEVTTFEEAVEVPAGTTRIVSVPVTEETEVHLMVAPSPRVEFDFGHSLADAQLRIDCTPDAGTHDARGRIGDVDCSSMTVDVTMDNGRSLEETTYSVVAESLAEDKLTYEQTFDVPAHELRTVNVPVTENFPLVVVVGAEGSTLTYEALRVDCTPGGGPAATIGNLNCRTLSVPVTLDNTAFVLEAVFVVYVGAPDDEDVDDAYYFLAAGSARVVSVRVHNSAEVAVLVDQEGFSDLRDALDLEIFDVECARVLAGRAGPRLADGELAATGANGLTLPIAGLTLLACGGVLTMLGRRHG
jgi:hypothetical protein